ncbi:hypothetical protein [Oligella urethralis]|nr:hypothetical protein [Oligella urethralis]AVL70697.1 hypothetical protein CEQ07_04185 [Oligella urethralis]SUA67900.1 Uncharacterised protein [Oligella urethralis]
MNEIECAAYCREHGLYPELQTAWQAAFESSFYRVLKEYNQLAHRDKVQAPRKVVKPTAWVAQAPNQVWT